MAARLAASIKVRTQLREGTCTLRALLRHPMDVGRGKDESGHTRKAHFITEVRCEHRGEPVLVAHWGGGIAKDPYLSVVFTGAAPGDRLTVSWEDNWGETDTLEVTL